MNNQYNSALMVPGDNQKHLENIDRLECDIVIVNLEDGVCDKDFARDLVFKVLKNKIFQNKLFVVRINDLNICGIKDIEMINKLKPDAVRIPKIKIIDDIKLALKLIDKDIDIHLSIETKEAFNNLKLFKLDKRVTMVYLGILDLLESLGLSQSLVQLNNPTIDYILSKFLIDSKSVGFDVVSFIYQEYKNIEVFKQWCLKEKLMGFKCKGCISPTQVKIANKIFKRTDDEITKAKYIIKVFEQNKANNITGFVDDTYGFIDEPIYKDALLIFNNLN